jgi:hypothetical protein
MRVQIVGNFQAGGNKTIQGWNSEYQEVDLARPARTWNKMNVTFPVCGPENNFHSPGLEFYRPVATKF